MRPPDVRGNRSVRLLIVDDSPDMVRNVQKLLYFEPDIQVVGAAVNAEEAFARLVELHPDVILMDINLRGKYDGLQATKIITQRWQTCVVMMSVQRESEYIQHAMRLGARGYLTKPFTGDELADTVRSAFGMYAATKDAMRDQVLKDVVIQPGVAAPWQDGRGPAQHSLHKIIAVYSPKGGVGRSVLAANLAVMLRRGTGRRVALVDANLTSGDAHILLNMTPTSGIEDLRETVGSSDYEQIQGMVAFHEDSGIGLIRSPMSVEVADRYTAEAMKAILVELSDHFDYIVVDTDTTYAPHTLTTLETATLVVLLTTLEITSVNQVSQFFEIVDRLDNVIPKIQLVCNRADPMYGIQAKHVEARFGRHCLALIPEDPRVVVASVNRGIPFVLSQKNAPISRAMERLAKRTVEILAQSDGR